MRHSVKLIAALSATVLLLAVAALAVWRALPAGADEMRRSMLQVESATWQEICAGGKPALYFEQWRGDTALVGVTAHRDSATHRSRHTAFWVNRFGMLPSCQGRVACVDSVCAGRSFQGSPAYMLSMCRRSVEERLATLKHQKSELDYYLRVHGVQDDGYQTVAALAVRVGEAYRGLEEAGRVIDSLAANPKLKVTTRSRTTYTARYRGDAGRWHTAPLAIVSRQPHGVALLQLPGHATPDGVCAVRRLPWRVGMAGDVRVVGYGGMGEQGLDCDTVQPSVVPGRVSAAGRHDIPRVLAADGSCVYTAKGYFVGLLSGGSVVRLDTGAY